METAQFIRDTIGQVAAYIPIRWEEKRTHPKDVDAQGDLYLDGKRYRVVIEAQKKVNHDTVFRLEALRHQYPNLLLVTEQLTAPVKKELRDRQLNYLQTNGNFFFKDNDTHIWLDGNRATEKKEQPKGGRAFTKTGLRVLFEFLQNEGWLNETYREIAQYTGTGIGNVNNILTGLRQEGYLVGNMKGKYRFTRKKELLDRWVDVYARKLQPQLHLGNFRFLKAEDFKNWKNIPINNDRNWWGGEAAANILTGYLQPAVLTLYTTEKKQELIPRYRLIPDDKGPLKVYQRFWRMDEAAFNVAPPLLVYADLMNANDARCRQAAQQIYELYLQTKF